MRVQHHSSRWRMRLCQMRRRTVSAHASTSPIYRKAPGEWRALNRGRPVLTASASPRMKAATRLFCAFA